MDFTKCTNKLVIADKLDQETSPKQLAVNNLKRKKSQPKAACFNCKKKGHKFWECKSPLRPDLQRRVDKDIAEQEELFRYNRRSRVF